MDIQRLREVQSRERSTDSLQDLPESFYSDVATYVANLKSERERAAARAADPFDDPEVDRLSDEIDAAEQVAESIYERRVGKLVKQASFAAADMGGDDSGLTAEERELYGDLVERIGENKRRVLDVLAGEASDPAPTEESAAEATARAETTETPEAAQATATAGSEDPASSGSSHPERDPVDAASLMGDGTTAEHSESTDGETPIARAGAAPDRDAESPTDAAGELRDDDSTASESDPDASPVQAGVEGDGGNRDPDENEREDRAAAPDSESATGADTERATVQVTRDVGEILGVDERVYDLEPDDVVTLPTENAAPLVEKGAADRLD
jgi:DNA replication factor GINS